jgi:hypothetical protein
MTTYLESRRPTGAENGQTWRERMPMFVLEAIQERDMATLRKEIALENSAERVWDALRDFHAVDKRVAPGFVTRSEPDGSARLITFANGTAAREDLVDCDDDAQRLVYAISNERLTHYNAAVQVFADGAARCKFVWTVDLLPNAMASYVGQQMDAAVKVMKPTLERAT